MSPGVEIELKSITGNRVLTADAIVQGIGLYRDLVIAAHVIVEIKKWLSSKEDGFRTKKEDKGNRC